jgi:hypothetical protein
MFLGRLDAAGGRKGRRAIRPFIISRSSEGRALFFEATLAFGRCSPGHQLDGNGLAVTDPIAQAPNNAAAIRSLATPHVRMVSIAGDSFPAV